MSEFIGFLPPPGEALSGYDSKQLHDAQTEGIPEVFREAMSIREEVYVEEQKVPLENEFDYDDPRSYHWVAYASVGTSSTQSEDTLAKESGLESGTISDRAEEQQTQGRKGSTASKLAVGTIRLVPPPHPPHPEAGSSHAIDNSEGPPTEEQMHDGKEAYIKLGRLAILKPFRGLKLGSLLINAALDWASQNQNAITPPISATAAEHRRLEGDGGEADEDWKGLVLVHAQKSIEAMWMRYGFMKDESMGVWDEEGIEHIGMWKRLELRPVRKSSVV